MSPVVGVESEVRAHRSHPGLDEFEKVYRANVGLLTAYFARRCADPQVVADLTSETVVRAAGGFGGFDPARGTARAWVFGIAANVYANHCAEASSGREAEARFAGRRTLEAQEIEELAGRIDALRAGRELMERAKQLPKLEREAIELVDLGGLTPKEAAAVLDVPRGVLRMRLLRARNKLRKEQLEP